MAKKTNISFFFLIVILFSCKHKSEVAPKPIFDSIQVVKKIFLLQENDTTQPFSDVEISFTYPQKFKSEDDLARLQQIFIGTFFGDKKYDTLSPKKAFDDYLTEYRLSYKELLNSYRTDKKKLENSSTPSWYWYSLNLKNRVLFQNDSLISYEVNRADYSGGAHGSLTISYYNIDLRSLTTMTEEDLFVPNYKKKLTKIIVKQLMQQYKVTTPQGLIEKGFFDVNEIYPNNNFRLDKEGVHYIYNQYEIAPYSMGALDVSIPYSELSEILKPNAIVHEFIVK